MQTKASHPGHVQSLPHGSDLERKAKQRRAGERRTLVLALLYLPSLAPVNSVLAGAKPLVSDSQGAGAVGTGMWCVPGAHDGVGELGC